MLMSRKCVLNLKRSRALGFDTRVLRLNLDMFVGGRSRSWSSPFMIVRCIRGAVLGTKVIRKAIWRRAGERPRKDESESQNEPNSAKHEALKEYRKTLENMFSDDECIIEIMWRVEEWPDDL